MIGRNGRPAGPPGARGYVLAGPPGPRARPLVTTPVLRTARPVPPDPEMVRRIQAEVSRRVARTGGDKDALPADLETEVRRVISEERIVGDDGIVDQLVRYVLAEMSGIGWLLEYLEDPDVENVTIIGSEPIFVDFAGGRTERRDPVVRSGGELVERIRALASHYGRQFGANAPYVHLRLPEGSRLSACVGVSRRPHVAIRRHRLMRQTLPDLVNLGTISADLARFLRAGVIARKNWVFSGAVDAGKTTFMRCMCAEIPPEESMYLVELVEELGLDRMPERHPRCLTHEQRDANTEGLGEVSMAYEVQQSVRFNTKRVMVGEVLGDEVIPMLRAMSSGRAGSMATIHAEDSADALERLTMYAGAAERSVAPQAANRMISHTIHFVAHLEQIWVGGNGSEPHMERVVSSVREVLRGTEDDYRSVRSQEVWGPGPDRRAVLQMPPTVRTAELLAANGWMHPDRQVH